LTLAAVPVGYGDAGKTCTAQTAMTNITQASTKADIITAAMEITDSQQAKIDQLQQRQVILIGLIALLSIINLLG
jgi:hypothetical protein